MEFIIISFNGTQLIQPIFNQLEPLIERELEQLKTHSTVMIKITEI